MDAKLCNRICGRINEIEGGRDAFVEGGGAAGPWVVIKSDVGEGNVADQPFYFGADDVWVGNRQDQAYSIETDVVGSSMNADLIARAILDALHTWEAMQNVDPT